MTDRQAKALQLAERISDILCVSEEDAKAIAAAADELVRPYSENEAFQAGYAAARLEIESLRAVLQVIAEWKSHDIQLAVDHGSNGVRDFYREKAASLLR